MYSKTCPIPVKNVRDKLIETTPLSSLLSDWCRGKHIDDFVMASCYWKAKYRMQCRGKRIDDFVMMSCDLKAKYRMCKRTFIPPCVYSDQTLFSPGFYGTAVLNV